VVFLVSVLVFFGPYWRADFARVFLGDFLRALVWLSWIYWSGAAFFFFGLAGFGSTPQHNLGRVSASFDDFLVISHLFGFGACYVDFLWTNPSC